MSALSAVLSAIAAWRGAVSGTIEAGWGQLGGLVVDSANSMAHTPVAKTRLTVQDGGSRPCPCTSVPLQSRLPPRYQGRGALFDLGCYLPPGGRRRRFRGGGELPVAKTRLTVQDGGSRPRPCTSVPLQSRLPPRYRGRGALFGLGCYLPPGGRRRRCRGGGELPVAKTRLTVQDLSLIHI